MGNLPDGTAVAVAISAYGIYVCPRSDRSTRQVRRVSFATIASAEIGSELSVAVHAGPGVSASDSGLLRVHSFRTAQPSISDFVCRRLLELPAYKRNITIEGNTCEVSFHPWRPGAAASLVEHIPTGLEPPVRKELYDSAIAEVEAIAKGQPTDPSAITTGLPAVLDITGLRHAWAHYFGALDVDDVLPARSLDAGSPSLITFFALKKETVWVIDADQSGRCHPRLRAVDAGSVVNTGKLSSANRFGLRIADSPDDHAYLAEGDEVGLEWLRRLDLATADR